MIVKKIFSVFATLSLLVNSFAMPVVAIAQETTPEPTPTETVEATAEPTVEPTVVPTETPTEVPTPTEVTSPTPESTVSPTDSTSLTTSPTAQPTLTPDPTSEPIETPSAAPVLTTDKEDYQPGETATILGRFFAPLQSFILKVFGSDENNGNYTESTQIVTTDENGAFTASYLLDNLYRPFYEMVVSTLNGTVLTSSWFRDMAVGTYDQCSNDDGDGYATGDTGCRWVNGNLQASNSAYHEHDSTVQRLWLEGLEPGDTHSVTFKYGTTKGGKHAYDFLTEWSHSETWISVADRCQDIDGCTDATEDTIAIPSDPNAALYETPNRVFTLRGGDLTNVSTPTVVSGSYAGDSETAITVTFNVGPGTGDMCSTKKVQGQDVTSCGVALWFGAHIAAEEDWGVGNGATAIPGSPYHVSLDAVDGESAGERDNQMQSATIVVPEEGNIVVVKQTDPEGDPTSFTFNPSWGDDFSLSDGQSHDSGLLLAGTYDVSETVPTGWDLTSASCVSSIQDTETPASIELDPEETVTCTFNNQKDSVIIVEKQTVPDGSQQTFEFDTDYGNNFTLSDGLTNNSGDLVPGTYSVDELTPTGWDETSATCSDQSPVGAISLQAGETVTCTFTNTQRGHVVIVKDVVGNPDPTDFTFNNNFGNGNPATFMLDEDNDGTLPNSRDFEVLPGSYSVSEDSVTGWQQESATCDSGETIGSIDVAAGETVTCTFVNEELISITLVKNTVGGNGTFDFTLTGNGLPASAQLITSGNTASQTFSGLDQDDSFSVAETVPTGWELISATCTGGEIPSSITPEPGEDVTCTFTNGKLPTLRLEKTVVNNNGGTADESNFQGKVDGTSVAWDATTTYPIGLHTASEEANVSGYTPSNWGADCAADGTITLAYGDEAVCSITNDDISPTLKLVKVVTNDDGGSEVANAWDLTAAGAGGFTELTPAAADATFHNITANQAYALSETGPAGYTPGEWSCDANLVLFNGSVTLGLNQHVTCTIVNDDQQAYIRVVKVVTNDNGGSADPDDFNLTLEEGAVLSGALTPVNPGTYTAGETLLPGYTFEGFSGDCNENGDITVALGETKTCTLTNNDQQAYITVVKEVINDNGGSAEPDDFNLTLEENAVSSGVAVPVNPGTYTAAETLVDGYSFSGFSGDCNVNGDTTVALGESKTCTLTNDDISPRLIVIKHVINDNGGSAVAGDFTMNIVTGNNPSDSSFPGEEAPGTEITIDAGDYEVNENAYEGYTKSLSEDCKSEVPIALGETKTCTITNDDIAPKLHLRKVVVNDNGGTAIDTDFTLTANGTGSNDLSGTSPVDSNKNLDADTFVLSETNVAGYTASDWVCVGGTQDGSNITLGINQEATCTITNDDISPTITIVKDAQPNDLEDFHFNGTLGDFSLDDDEGVFGEDNVFSDSMEFTNVIAGNHTITEILPNQFWLLSSATCVDDQQQSYTSNLNGMSLSFNLPLDTHITCTFVNQKLGPTRTLGFWQTHTAYTRSVFDSPAHTYPWFSAHNIIVGSGVDEGSQDPIDTVGKLFGGFYSNIAKKSTNQKRTVVDQARMQLAQQLLAAELNCAAFGCPSEIQTLIANANTAYASGNIAQIKQYAGQLDVYNNSGDTITIGPAGSATPQTSKSLADLVFWNNP